MAKDKLFNLVHSLTAGEKKFFRQYSKRHVQGRDAVYLQIFDAIDAQKKYEEAALKVGFAHPSFKENFHNVKAYLYDMIMLSLLVMDRDRSEYRNALARLCYVEILREKMLFNDALEELKKVRAIAEEYEFTEIALEINHWEEIIFIVSRLVNQPRVSMRDIYTEQRKLIRQVTSITEYRQLYFRALMLQWRQTPEGSAEYNEIIRLFNHPLMHLQKEPKNKRELKFYYGLKFVESKLKNDPESALPAMDKLVTLLEKFPRQFYYHKFILIYCYFNLINECIISRKWSMAGKAIGRMKGLPLIIEQDQYFRFHLLFAGELNYLSALQKKEECIALIDDYEKKLSGYRKSINRRVEFMNDQLIMNYFMKVKKYYSALTFINRILNERIMEDYSMPNFIQARLLNLAVHFELRNYDVLDHYIRQTAYFFSHHLHQSNFMEELLKFFKKIIKPETDCRKAFTELGNRLKSLPLKPTEQLYLNNLLETGWLQQHGVHIQVQKPRVKYD